MPKLQLMMDLLHFTLHASKLIVIYGGMWWWLAGIYKYASKINVLLIVTSSQLSDGTIVYHTALFNL